MKTLLGFLAGAVLASGIAYVVVQRGPQPVAAIQTPVVQPVVVDPGRPAVTAVQTAPGVLAEQVQTLPARKLMVAAAAKEPVRAADPIRRIEAAVEASPPPPPAPVQVTVTPAPAEAAPPAPITPEPKREPPPTPPPAPTPRTLTIPAGTPIPARLTDSLSSDRNASGDTFGATLDQPLVVDGLVIAERGARLEGRVVESVKAGRVKGVSQLVIELTRLHTSDGQRVAIQTESHSREGQTAKKEDAAKVGAGAAIGAALGAIIGGGKGAGIGAGAGGAAGAGDVLLTRGKPVNLPVESRVSFRLREPLNLTEKLH